ncbi:MAG: Branched-chain-amino-acid transaminase [Bacteroidota bacterium]|jgi:D-alanine transaminase/branched-chain amino acid aminotransferase
MEYPIYHNFTWKKASDVHVSIKDVGFLRGFGIFDFFRIIEGKPVFLKDHLDRFLSSASKMGISHSYKENTLTELILELASMSQDECLGVKMVLSAGESLNGFDPVGESQLYIIPSVFSFADFQKGMRLKSIPFQREMADIKSLNYAFALRHWGQIKAEGFDDYLYYTNEKGVTECSRSNLFMVKNKKVITPLNGILEGITRKKIVEICESEYDLEVRDVGLNEFLDADEVFTTGSTKRVVPIFEIDGKEINRREVGEITLDLYNQIKRFEQ